MRRIRSGIATFGLAIGMLILPASAQIKQTDLLVAGRALGFIDNLKPGTLRVGIVYDPAIAQSAQQAAELNAAMAGGLRVGTLVLEPVMTPLQDVAGGNAGALLLTVGLGEKAAQARQVSRRRHIPCITFDLRQVRDGNCAVGVRSQPKIEVIVNRAEAQACGLDFAAVFRLMITEI